MVKIENIKGYFHNDFFKKDIKQINEELNKITGIEAFFNNDEELQFFKNIILENDTYEIKESDVEHGDFQTPSYFTDKICKYLKEQLLCNPQIIIEPTFGLGNFIHSSMQLFSSCNKYYGIELQDKYILEFKLKILEDCLNSRVENNNKLQIFHESIFKHDFKKNLVGHEKNEFLIIGNPPWVTNSQLSSLGSENLPQKSNFKKSKGLDAITGKSNFDIAEYIILQLLNEFYEYNGILAMLCKNTVAKNIVRDLRDYDFKISDMKILNIDTKEIFGVSCDASLFVACLGKDKKDLYCSVYNFQDYSQVVRRFGWTSNGNFVSNIDSYDIYHHIDGICPFVWRQGLKHDASKVMELSIDKKSGALNNGLKEQVEVEDYYIYHHLKSSDLKKIETKQSRKKVIVTQKKVREETDSIKDKAPLLWEYLNEHGELLDKRKSSIYKNAPRFSIFGIGEYSFAPFKVAISGFYKNPVFSLVHPMSNKPTMLDDTCYFIGFEDYKAALITTLILNSEPVQLFLKSIAFLDAKRPYTKDILMRLDIPKACEIIEFDDLLNVLNEKKIQPIEAISEIDYENYRAKLESKNLDKFQFKLSL